MDKLPANVKEIFDFVNWFLVFAQMVALFTGLRKFRDVPLVGSWFRWKALGYTLIIFGADLVAIYFLWKGNPLFAAIRLTMSRVVVLWGTLYCFYYRFNKLSDGMKLILRNPWMVDPSLKPYVPITIRLWPWLKKATSFIPAKK